MIANRECAISFKLFSEKIYLQLQSGSSGLVQCVQSLSVSTASGEGTSNNNNSSSSSSGNSDRRRRTGLSTVMQRPGMTQTKFQQYVKFLIFFFRN